MKSGNDLEQLIHFCNRGGVLQVHQPWLGKIMPKYKWFVFFKKITHDNVLKLYMYFLIVNNTWIESVSPQEEMRTRIGTKNCNLALGNLNKNNACPKNISLVIDHTLLNNISRLPTFDWIVKQAANSEWSNGCFCSN